MQLAGMVGVGVERGYGDGRVFAVDANPFPVERGGDLQRNAGERSFAVVAHRDQRADGNMLLRGEQPHVHIEVSEGHGLALGVFGHLRWGQLRLRRGDGRGCGSGGLAVLVGRARKDDLAAGLLLRCGWRGLRGRG